MVKNLPVTFQDGEFCFVFSELLFLGTPGDTDEMNPPFEIMTLAGGGEVGLDIIPIFRLWPKQDKGPDMESYNALARKLIKSMNISRWGSISKNVVNRMNG